MGGKKRICDIGKNKNINILEGNTKAILKGEKPQKIQKDELLRLPFSVEIVKKGLDK